MNLQGKTIIVTGASSGIGKSVVKTLDKYGATVIMIARNKEKLEEVKNGLSGNHKYYTYDLSNIEGIEELVKQIVTENGKLDGFVHSAGLGPTRPLNMTTFGFIHSVMLVNFYSFVEMCRVFAKKKNNNGGSIVAVSSMASFLGDNAKTAYCASKAALDGAVRSIAAELSAKRIRVNSVQPGWVRTEMFEEYLKTGGDDARNRFINNPKNTVVEPGDIAETIAFLLSDNSSVLSGVSMVTNAASR